jgi:hypothetical protein
MKNYLLPVPSSLISMKRYQQLKSFAVVFIFLCFYLPATIVSGFSIHEKYSNSPDKNCLNPLNDDIPPVAVCQNITVQLDASGYTEITSLMVDGGSYDLGGDGTIDLSIDKYEFTCEDLGENEVVLTVSDFEGNVSYCTSIVTVLDDLNPCQTMECTINAIPSPGAYTGAPATTIYLGYGPQSVTLESTVTGNGEFTYSWSPATGLNCTDCSSPLFTPTEEGIFTFVLTASNSSGYSTTCEITICVLDIRVPGSNGKRVYICHILPTGDEITLGLPINVVPHHIPGHAGDHPGRCDQSCDALKNGMAQGAYGELISNENDAFETIIYPNPFNNTIDLFLESHSEKPVRVFVYDMTGRLVEKLTDINPEQHIKLGQNLVKGIYMIHVHQDGQVQMIKVMKSN